MKLELFILGIAAAIGVLTWSIYLLLQRRKERKLLIQFPPGTGKTVTKTYGYKRGDPFEHTYNGQMVMLEVKKNYLYARVVSVKKKGTNYITVTITVEYWTEVP